MDGETIGLYTEAASAIRGAREMLRELYPAVEPQQREKLKAIDRVLLDGLGCFIEEGPDAIVSVSGNNETKSRVVLLSTSVAVRTSSSTFSLIFIPGFRGDAL